MKRFIRTPRGAVLILVVAALAVEVWAGGVITLPAGNITGGGGSSSGGDYGLTGTIGQPLAGRVSGGQYVLHGGMWHPVTGSTTPVGEELPGVPVNNRLNKAKCTQPALSTEACVTAEIYFVDDSGSSAASGTWKDPVNTVNNAQNLAPSGSALVLFPGTFNEGGSGGVILKQPVRLYSATSSVIK